MAELVKKLFKNKLFIITCLLAVISVTLLLLSDTILMPAYTNHNEGITVPDLTHLSFDEAKNIINEYGFRFDLVEKRTNSALPPLYIIEQNPSAGTIVKPNRKIHLVVNTASLPTVRVPDLKNLSVRNAILQLQNNDLQIGTINYQTSRFKNVIGQSIEAGKAIKKGSKVSFTIGNGLGSDN
jgi:beta-lactam-binding protein with PASTA domain